MPDSLKKILICSSEESVRESLKLILSDHYDLALTDSSEQGMDIINNDQTIRLLLSDPRMPKVNGLELTAAVQEKRPEIKALIITKPFKSAEVLNLVQENFR